MKKNFLPLILFATSSNVYGYNLEGACSLEAFAGTALFYTPEIFNFKASDSSIKQNGEFHFKLPNLYIGFSVAMTDNLEIGLEAGGINLLGVFVKNFDLDYTYTIASGTILSKNLVSADDITKLDTTLLTENAIKAFLTNSLTEVKATQNIKTKYIATKLNCPFEIFDGFNINFGGIIGIAKPQYTDEFHLATSSKGLPGTIDKDSRMTVEYSADDFSFLTGLQGGVKYEYSDNLSFGFNILWKNYSPIKSKTKITFVNDTTIINSPTTIKEFENQTAAAKLGFNYLAWSISGTINF